MKEKRKAKRDKAPLSVDYTEASDQIYLFYRTKDISQLGAYIVTDDPLPKGSKIELVLSLYASPNPAKAAKQFVVKGKIARICGEVDPVTGLEPGMGVEFTNMTDKKWKAIQQYIKQEKQIAGLKSETVRISSRSSNRLREIGAAQKRLKKEFELFWKEVTKS